MSNTNTKTASQTKTAAPMMRNLKEGTWDFGQKGQPHTTHTVEEAAKMFAEGVKFSIRAKWGMELHLAEAAEAEAAEDGGREFEDGTGFDCL